MRTCIKCKKMFPKTSEYFYYRNKNKEWLSSWCKSCKKEHRKLTWNNELQQQRKRRNNNPRAERKSQKEYNRINYLKHREEIIIATKTYAKQNPDKGKLANKNYRRNHPLRKRAEGAYRRAYKINATPQWADLKGIREFYENCPDGFHVDHIIPLKGKLVNGLHVLNNLQYLTAKDNLSKSNHYSLGEGK